MAIFIEGLIGIGVFFILVFLVGIWASRLSKDDSVEEVMLMGRGLGFWIGALTLIATWVGGGYINGASEIMFSRGLLWAQVPVGYSIALLLGAVLFVRPMRDMRCVTLLDPFQAKYGKKIGGLLFVPCIFGDFFWVSTILCALGSSLMVITDLDPVFSVVISACFVAAYTSVGAMYSVTYTDVVQIFCVLFGLSEYLNMEVLSKEDWLGHVTQDEVWQWADVMLLLMLGGIPWQGYMQRVLAIKSTRLAQGLSAWSMIGCILMAVPPLFIGVLARSVDWSKVEGFNRTMTAEEATIILPLALRYLTPPAVAFVGLGAISAAVMSSADSSVLAFSAMFTLNIYKNMIRSKASDKEVLWVLRCTVVVITSLATVMALSVRSIYYLSVLSSDLIYVIMFPQLLLVVYMTDFVNSYGCLASIIVATLLRVLSGEPSIGIPALIHYPGYDPESGTQRAPYRTIAMLLALLTHLCISWLAKFLFKKCKVASKYDLLNIFHEDSSLEIHEKSMSELSGVCKLEVMEEVPSREALFTDKEELTSVQR